MCTYQRSKVGGKARTRRISPAVFWRACGASHHRTAASRSSASSRDSGTPSSILTKHMLHTSNTSIRTASKRKVIKCDLWDRATGLMLITAARARYKTARDSSMTTVRVCTRVRANTARAIPRRRPRNPVLMLSHTQGAAGAWSAFTWRPSARLITGPIRFAWGKRRSSSSSSQPACTQSNQSRLSLFKRRVSSLHLHALIKLISCTS